MTGRVAARAGANAAVRSVTGTVKTRRIPRHGRRRRSRRTALPALALDKARCRIVAARGREGPFRTRTSCPSGVPAAAAGSATTGAKRSRTGAGAGPSNARARYHHVGRVAAPRCGRPGRATRGGKANTSSVPAVRLRRDRVLRRRIRAGSAPHSAFAMQASNAGSTDPGSGGRPGRQRTTQRCGRRKPAHLEQRRSYCRDIALLQRTQTAFVLRRGVHGTHPGKLRVDAGGTAAAPPTHVPADARRAGRGRASAGRRGLPRPASPPGAGAARKWAKRFLRA